MQGSEFGLDPEVLDYLMQKRRPQIRNPDNQMMAAMANASSAMGTLGGKQADTSSVQRMADAADARNMQQGQMMDARQAKLAQYLQGVRDKNTQRQQRLSDIQSQRDYDTQRLAENRAYQNQMAQGKMALAEQQRQKQRAEGMEDWKTKQQLSSQMKQQEMMAKAKPKDYESQMGQLSGEQLKRFDSAAMGLEAVVEMQKALQGGSNTFSLVGDNPYTMASSRFEEALGRMQSGGAITSDEVAKFRKMAPTFTDSTEIQRAKMDNLIAEMAGRVQNLGFDPDEVLQRRSSLAQKVKQQYAPTKIVEPDTAYASQPQMNFQKGEVREINGKKYQYMGNDIWQEAQ